MTDPEDVYKLLGVPERVFKTLPSPKKEFPKSKKKQDEITEKLVKEYYEDWLNKFIEENNRPANESVVVEEDF